MASSRPSESVESIEPSPLLDNLPQEILEIVLNAAVDSFSAGRARLRERMKQRMMAGSWHQATKVVKEYFIEDIETARGVLAELDREGMGRAVKQLVTFLVEEGLDEVVAEIIRKCSNIERLTVLLEVIYSEDMQRVFTSTHTSTLSAIAQLSNLKSLDLKAENDECFMVDGSVVSQIITNCTKLQHLRLPPISSPLPPAPISLISLYVLLGSNINLLAIDPLIRGSTTLRKLEIVIRMDGPFNTMEEGLCGLLSTLPYLDHLVYTNGLEAEDFIEIISKIASLTRLDLNFRASASNITFLAKLSNLKHFTINCLGGEEIRNYTNDFKEFTTALETFTIKHDHSAKYSCRDIEAEVEIQGLIEALGDTKFSEIYV